MLRKSPLFLVGRYLLAGVCLPGLLLSGLACQKQEGVHTYQTEKQESVFARNHVEQQAPDAPPRAAAPQMAAPAAAVEGPVRMFAAIVPRGEQLWFYKLTGPVEAVQAEAETLAQFIREVKYTSGQPEWTLPENWEQKPGNQFRFATLMIPSAEAPLEMSVTVLPGNPEAEVEQVLDNINRWRGQVALGPIEKEAIEQASDDLNAETSKHQAGESRVYFVNIVGTQQETGMSPPFAR